MADNLPLSFPVPSSPALASYNYVDIATGTGYRIFYGNAVTYTNAGVVKYILTDNSGAYSAKDGYTSIPNGANPRWDQDFDITFSLPQTIEGKALVCIPCANPGGGGPYTQYLEVKIIHYDSVTESIIGAEIKSETFENPYQKTQVLEINCTKKVFKRGEILRVSVKATSSEATTTFYVGHSPNGTQGGTIFTTISPRMILFVPFRIKI
jgi:hypothetical protein